MSSIRVIDNPTIVTRIAARASGTVYYPVWVFRASLILSPLLGPKKTPELVVLVDGIDCVARVYRDCPQPREVDPSGSEVMPPSIDETQAAKESKKRLQTYALARYRGLTSSEVRLGEGKLVHKMFCILAGQRNADKPLVIDCLTGQQTVLRKT